MTAADWMMDGALALALPFLAWRTLASDSLRKAVVLFIALGLLSAVGWARLHAPDVALVEAAVGSGLTGALLMSALGRVTHEGPLRRTWLARLVLPALLLALAAGPALAVLTLPSRDEGLRSEVLFELERSGVAHPVTAVLLNFRGYDTLLEITVLLVAAIGAAWSHEPDATTPAPPPAPELLPVLVRALVPGIMLVAGYFLWSGSHAPGGAFQAGALLGGAGILLILSGTIRPPALSSAWVRAALVLGPSVFLAVAAASMLGAGHLLEYPRALAGGLILAIEASLTVSIGLMLTLFFTAVASGGAPGAQP